MKITSNANTHDWETKRYDESWNARIDTYLICKRCGYIRSYSTMALDKNPSCDDVLMDLALR